MPKERSHHEILDFLRLLLRKDINGKRRPLAQMLGHYLLEQLGSIFHIHLSLYHGMKNEIHNSQKSTNLFIWELILTAEIVVYIMKIQNDLIDFINLFVWRFSYCIQVENLA